jgi:uncharacterized protein YgfB (UPF0149 family)
MEQKTYIPLYPAAVDKMPNKKDPKPIPESNTTLVDDINNELDSFEQAESEASYLAYEWGDEIMDAYSELSLKYNIDDYIVNGQTTNLEEYAEKLLTALLELQTKAEELGINPNEILYDFDDIKQRVDNASSLNSDAKAKYREIISWVGLNDFWR